MRFPIALSLLPILLLSSGPAAEPEGPELAKRQCRSVHLGYKAPDADWAVIDVVARRSAPGTYFCALGFSRGYFGMQEMADGSKRVLFSVWDSPDQANTTDRPEDTDEKLRVGVVKVGKGVHEQRFGGEGTGSQSFISYEWKDDKPVRFAVHAAAEGELSTYSGWFYDERRRKWQHMASFRTRSTDPLKGLYSFVEDFRRNIDSATRIRRADFVNGWARSADGRWNPLVEARFTADPTPSDAIDADPVEDGFFLQTGGATRNEHTKLWETMTRPAPKADSPDGLEALLKEVADRPAE